VYDDQTASKTTHPELKVEYFHIYVMFLLDTASKRKDIAPLEAQHRMQQLDHCYLRKL
jgi:hypothetical protein